MHSTAAAPVMHSVRGDDPANCAVIKALSMEEQVDAAHILETAWNIESPAPESAS